jgi:hypothetical protein
MEVDFAYERYEDLPPSLDTEVVEKRIETIKEIAREKKKKKGKGKVHPQESPEDGLLPELGLPPSRSRSRGIKISEPIPEGAEVVNLSDSDLEAEVAETLGDTLVDNLLASGFFYGDFQPDRSDDASGSGAK